MVSEPSTRPLEFSPRDCLKFSRLSANIVASNGIRSLMFFLRCAFWLSIVYSSMSWTNTAFDPRGSVATQTMVAGRAVAASVIDKAVAGATDFCASHAAECLAQASRLTSLVAATDTPNARAATTEPAAVPLPVPDPRRRTQYAKLAPTP